MLIVFLCPDISFPCSSHISSPQQTHTLTLAPNGSPVSRDLPEPLLCHRTRRASGFQVCREGKADNDVFLAAYTERKAAGFRKKGTVLPVPPVRSGSHCSALTTKKLKNQQLSSYPEEGRTQGRPWSPALERLTGKSKESALGVRECGAARVGEQGGVKPETPVGAATRPPASQGLLHSGYEV